MDGGEQAAVQALRQRLQALSRPAEGKVWGPLEREFLPPSLSSTMQPKQAAHAPAGHDLESCRWERNKNLALLQLEAELKALRLECEERRTQPAAGHCQLEEHARHAYRLERAVALLRGSALRRLAAAVRLRSQGGAFIAWRDYTWCLRCRAIRIQQWEQRRLQLTFLHWRARVMLDRAAAKRQTTARRFRLGMLLLSWQAVANVQVALTRKQDVLCRRTKLRKLALALAAWRGISVQSQWREGRVKQALQCRQRHVFLACWRGWVNSSLQRQARQAACLAKMQRTRCRAVLMGWVQRAVAAQMRARRMQSLADRRNQHIVQACLRSWCHLAAAAVHLRMRIALRQVAWKQRTARLLLKAWQRAAHYLARLHVSAGRALQAHRGRLQAWAGWARRQAHTRHLLCARTSRRRAACQQACFNHWLHLSLAQRARRAGERWQAAQQAAGVAHQAQAASEVQLRSWTERASAAERHAGRLQQDALQAVPVAGGRLLSPDLRWREVTTSSGTLLPRARHSAICLAWQPDEDVGLGGAVAVFGGVAEERWLADVHVRAALATTPCLFMVALVLRAVYMFGGYRSSAGCLCELWAFRLDLQEWTQPVYTGVPPAARRGHVAVLVDSYLYVAAGFNGEQHYEDLHRLHLDTWHWEQVATCGPPPSARRSAAAHLLDGRFWVLHGGYNGRGHLADTHVLDMRTHTWAALEVAGGCVPFPRALHTLTPLAGRLLVVGGQGPAGAVASLAILENPAACEGVRLHHRWCSQQAELAQMQAQVAEKTARASLAQQAQQIAQQEAAQCRQCQEAAEQARRRAVLDLRTMHAKLDRERGRLAGAEAEAASLRGALACAERRAARARQGGLEAGQAAAQYRDAECAARMRAEHLERLLAQAQAKMAEAIAENVQQASMITDLQCQLSSVHAPGTSCHALSAEEATAQAHTLAVLESQVQAALQSAARNEQRAQDLEAQIQPQASRPQEACGEGTGGMGSGGAGGASEEVAALMADLRGKSLQLVSQQLWEALQRVIRADGQAAELRSRRDQLQARVEELLAENAVLQSRAGRAQYLRDEALSHARQVEHTMELEVHRLSEKQACRWTSFMCFPK
ncbi:hypothetical protein WJX72_006982 [[Myrmecia] bisecta]|uniref:Uncharacterized protein n=1 Tax=[Myrmecia] bisecta TaxID=41462 RepID=A0AAW1R7L7_9CHLO